MSEAKDKKDKKKGKESDKKDEELKHDNAEIDNWLTRLYDPELINDKDLFSYYDVIKYQGFSRELVVKQLYRAIPDVKEAAIVILTCAVRGPKAASKIKLPSGKILEQIGIPASGGKGKDTLTCNKIQAATADLAAYYMRRVDVPKRIISDLPGWLQFPSAGSIKLPENYRSLHIEFSKKFSPMIGGEFNESIYTTMMANSYLDPKLKLFS
jgi:hypothetical protein